MTNRLMLAAGCGAALLLAACGGTKEGAPAADTAASAASASQAGAPATPDAGGRIDTVQLIADDKGSRFEPSEITAKKGDVVHFVLNVGVHNVDFLPDSNPGAQGLPAKSDLLQLPGQAYDYKVDLKPGKYYFQCDPHAALGMKGHLTVE